MGWLDEPVCWLESFAAIESEADAIEHEEMEAQKAETERRAAESGKNDKADWTSKKG